MIIIVYHDLNETRNFTDSERWIEFEEEGIKIINVEKELPHIFQNDDIYIIPNDGHPSALAWSEIVDHIINKLHIFYTNILPIHTFKTQFYIFSKCLICTSI